MRQAVEQRLQRAVFRRTDADEVDVRASVKFARSGTGFAATVLLETEQGNPIGTRELTTAKGHCSALDESLVLALALMLDLRRENVAEVDQRHRLKDPAEQPEPKTEPEQPTVRPTSTTAQEPIEARVANPPTWRFRGGAGAVAGWGLLPGFALGLRAGVGFAPPKLFWVEADATAFLGTEAGDEGGRAQFSWWGLGIFLCPVELRDTRAGGAACLGSHVGWFRFAGVDFDENLHSTRHTVHPGVRVRGALRVAGPLALRGGVELLVPLVRDRFVYAQANGARSELFRAGPVAAVAELGLGLEVD